MVMEAVVKIVVNGKDITTNLYKQTSNITLNDEANEEADELSFEVVGAFKRPKFGDEVLFYLGWEVPALMGKYFVQTTERSNNQKLTVSCTSVDFNGKLKEKKDRTHTGNLKGVVEKIAKEHKLKSRCDCDDVILKGYAQSDESDLNLLNKIATEYNLIFNIKNGTIVVLHRELDGKINSELPRYEISANDVGSLTISQNSSDYYKSCKAIWREVKKNKMSEVVVGSGSPCLVIKGCYKNESEAKRRANAAIKIKEREQTTGNIDMVGLNIFAGGVLVLSDTIEEDGEYYIKRVSHTISDNGWHSSLEFEK